MARALAMAVGAEVCRCADCVPYGQPHSCDRARIADPAMRVIRPGLRAALQAAHERAALEEAAKHADCCVDRHDLAALRERAERAEARVSRLREGRDTGGGA